MQSATVKPFSPRNNLVRVLLFGILIIVIGYGFVFNLIGESFSCENANFCLFSASENLDITGEDYGDGNNEEDSYETVHFYSSVFEYMIAEGYMTPTSEALCVEITLTGQDVFVLKSVHIDANPDSISMVSGQAHSLPFDDNRFDLVFTGGRGGGLDRTTRPVLDIASEITRTLKPQGVLVFHITLQDTYSFDSFFRMFRHCCKLVRYRDNIDGFNSSMTNVQEIVMKKDSDQILNHGVIKKFDGDSMNKCSIPGYKRELVPYTEPLIIEEPLKPWLTLKGNLNNIKYLPSMVDINFKQKYVYVDVGARNYDSSIGSWFMKQYPKQNKTFQVYAIEADKAFHNEYRLKKGVTLLPYAAWVRNESLSFEINPNPGKIKGEEDKGRGMGRIQPVQPSNSLVSDVDKIQGFDFANWLKSTVTERDFLVMKMDVEGTEFDLIPRLFETGAICLIDEIFLECHYNRWQRCCPGERSSKYQKTYGQCLELLTSLRESGVLVHQWW